MRRLFLILTTTVSIVTPALAANPMKDEQSAELKQCIQECRQEKDATAREACDVKCVQTDAARQKQGTETPNTQGSQPQK